MQREGVETLEASGALDELYAMIDAGQVRLEGKDGLIQQLIKAGLERGLQAELAEHLGYEKGDPEAGLHPNSRNGTSAKTVATSVGDVELAIPRDREGSFTPVLVPKGLRRVGGLDDMIVSLYAGGMAVRDIPKLRESSYLPDWLLERRRRAEAALTSVDATCYLLGASTRRMDRLVQSLGITGLSKSQVSVMARDLDEPVRDFREGPHDTHPYQRSEPPDR